MFSAKNLISCFLKDHGRQRKVKQNVQGETSVLSDSLTHFKLGETKQSDSLTRVLSGLDL